MTWFKTLQNLSFLLIVALFFNACVSIDKAEQLYYDDETEKAFEMAVSLLEDDDAKVRLRAIKLVRRIGKPKAGSALRKRLKDANHEVRREAIMALGQIQYQPAVDDLLDLVSAANDDDTIKALGYAFREYGTNAIDLLVERYESGAYQKDREKLTAVLIQVGPTVADSIIKTLKGKSFFENKSSFEILVQVKNPRVAVLMLPYLQDIEVREQIVEALSKLGTSAVDPTLTSLKKSLASNEIPIIEAHIVILGNLGDPRATSTLEPLSQHDDDRIRDAVDSALRKIRGF